MLVAGRLGQDNLKRREGTGDKCLSRYLLKLPLYLPTK